MNALSGPVSQAVHVRAAARHIVTSIHRGKFKQRIFADLKTSTPYAAMLVFAFVAHAQTGSLDTITTVGNTFATWLRAFAGILGIIAIVWGGINMYFSDLGRGMAKVVAGIVGLIVAGYAQSIVNTFFTTSS
jgi:type IV secretory pathway VirB2 component (pilin)